MKKLELLIILIFGVVLWWWTVFYYNQKPSIEFKRQNTNVNSENNITIIDKLNQFEVEFKKISKWKTYTQLIKSKDYKNWVDNLNDLLLKNKKEDNNDNIDYIYYNFIPRIVQKYLSNYSTLEIDLVIQSIRRLDFNTLSDKNYYLQVMKDYVDQKYYKPILEETKNIDKTKLDKDKTYFYKIMLDPQNWIFYRIFKNRYDWNKTWIGFKPEFMENQFVDYLSQRFEQILNKFWYNKIWFKSKVFEYYNIKLLKELAWLIRQDYNTINKDFNLNKLWIPTDRFFRQDERRWLFKYDGLHKTLYKQLWNRLNEFKNKVKQLRLKMYLLSYLWKDINMFNHKVRANFVDPDGAWWLQNIFRVWRYVDEVMKLDLKPKIK